MSLGETLSKALMDTLMGMGTVFVILILICLIISLFKFIPKPESSGNAVSVPEPAAAASSDSEDDEITAVIMAAIRMHLEREAGFREQAGESEGPGYIVRSVKRRK